VGRGRVNYGCRYRPFKRILKGFCDTLHHNRV
jgi:hypothetical protein